MSEYTSNYEGVNWTEKYLTVSFTTGHGASKRFRNVKVPMKDLAHPQFMLHLNSVEAARLRRHWEAGQPPLPGT